MRTKTALITGITGQDGSYLAEFLLEKGYEVHGILRPVSTFNRERIDHIFDTEEKREKFLHYADLTDPLSIAWVLKEVQPDEIYHLGAMTHVHISWKMPLYTAQATGVATANLLEAIRLLDMEKKVKVYNACTSELFSGRKGEAPQDENTTKDPVSPYGTSKLFSFQIAKNYREGYGMFISNGILFNHESPRRGENFVTKKIINALKKDKEVHLGNLNASRDWGAADDYIKGMWLMLQQDKPDDYILATGETHTIKEFIETAEKLVNKKLNIIIDEKFIRPHDVDLLCGNPNKAKSNLMWNTSKNIKQLISWMFYENDSQP